MSGARTPEEQVARVFREESGVVLAALIARFGDFDLAEDALQDACAQALRTWAEAGVPDRPAAWLTTAARRRILDRLRHDRVRADKAPILVHEETVRREIVTGGAEEEPVPDERLRLIFTCCHPSLSREAQVALTLKTLGGLSTAEVARAFLTSETTMGRRLARAKKKIRDAGIPYRVPPPEQLPGRLDAVLAVLYLVFNEGYAARSGDAPIRRELSGEAIRLARILAGLLGAEGEVHGLLALMLLHDSRRAARTDAEGVVVPLEEQDRALWDGRLIAEGLAALDAAARCGPLGAYQLQARISAEHARSRLGGETDWSAIVDLYDRLLALHPSPVIALNRAVAVSRAQGAAEGLRAIERIVAEPAARGLLAEYQPFHAARADLLARAGQIDAAEEAYGRAIALSHVRAERALLERRRAALRG